MKYLNYKFAHHHVHSEYSPWDAPVALKKLVKYSKELGYKTVTITDHGRISAWVKLALLCKENGMKPIFGTEAYFVADRKERNGKRHHYHLVLIAKNNVGMRNICRLSELSYREGYFNGDPRIDWELLEKYHEGIICSTACISGPLAHPFKIRPDNEKDIELHTIQEDGKVIYGDPYALARANASRLKSIFGADLRAEVQYHNIPAEDRAYEGVVSIAKEFGIPLLGTNDAHYLRKEDCPTQDIMTAVNLGKCIKDEKRLRHGTNQLYLKSPDEMIEVFGGKNTAAVQNALEIADICNAEMQFGRNLFPSVEIPPEFSNAMDFLEHLSWQGLKERGKSGNPVYEARLKEELSVVRRLREKGKEFDKYFIVVWDYIRWARENGVWVGKGRGSGCGSLILWCLKITGLDPLPYDLLFERFLAEDRNEMPDIDTDFDSDEGDRVFQYVCEKYGGGHVAKICTYQVVHCATALKAAIKVFDPCGTYEKELAVKAASEQTKKARKHKASSGAKEKSSVRDETAAMGNMITKMLPMGPNGTADPKCTLLEEVYKKDPDGRIYVYKDVPPLLDYKRKYPEIFQFAENIEGIVMNVSRHASGVLIAKEELADFIPQQFSGSGTKKELTTAFDMNDIDKLGGVKFDFLMVKVLSVLRRCVRTVEQRHNVKIDIENFEPTDAKALNIFRTGDTVAVFQFESRFMREILKEMECSTFEDVIAANAMGRPGPMKYIPTFCNRKKGKERVVYAAAVLETVLKPTYGVMVYQEQVMKACRVLAGFTGSEADKVRKAMGKKKKDVLEQMKEKFLKGCKAQDTCSEDVAAKIWSDMEEFAEYAFNKSHAAAYAYTAYQCAYLKAHYPAEYMAAQLSVESADSAYEKCEEYESAARSMGIRVLKPDLNKSKVDYTVVDMPDGKPAILTGFKGIKGFGGDTCEQIVKSQPYKSIYDYCRRCEGGQKEALAKDLIDKGAFDCLKAALKKRKNLTREVTIRDLENEYDEQKERAKVDKAEDKKNDGQCVFSTEETDYQL
jgi:DNA polymerase-3 subunit alpha